MTHYYYYDDESGKRNNSNVLIFEEDIGKISDYYCEIDNRDLITEENGAKMKRKISLKVHQPEVQVEKSLSP